MTGRPARVAITGTTGRLGSALLARAGPDAVAWRRADFDLDRTADFPALLERDRPTRVIHPAAMTDVDACARDPELALRRNGEAVGALARACAERGSSLVLISTNEVFDGEREDGIGYAETDAPRPRNAYGVSKLAGEQAARAELDEDDGLWIVRTAWLYGPPGDGFPEKIVRAADRAPADEPLPVVADETGSPTLAADLAAGVLALVEATPGGTFHLVGAGRATRLEWARRVLAARRPERRTRPISQAEFERASDPPAWGVLATDKAASAGVVMRSWQDALDEHLATTAG